MQLRVKNESDLYNPYDPTQTKINDKVYHYLKSFCTELEFKNHLHDTLRIITSGPIDEDRFGTALRDAVRKDRDEFDRQIAENNRRVIWEYLVGIVLSAGGVALSLWRDQVLLALISFLGTTAIGNAVTIQTTVNHDIKRLKRLLDPFSDFKLEVIRVSEEESPASEEEMKGEIRQ